MKELTTGDKATIVLLLEKYYTIKEKHFIDAIASNEEERMNLTLIAYVIGAEQKNTPTNVSTNTSVVVIDNLYSKLQFIKAVKETKDINLKEAKDFADRLLIGDNMTAERCYSKPFPIGNSSDCIFTEDQWAKISALLKGSMYWKYV